MRMRGIKTSSPVLPEPRRRFPKNVPFLRLRGRETAFAACILFFTVLISGVFLMWVQNSPLQRRFKSDQYLIQTALHQRKEKIDQYPARRVDDPHRICPGLISSTEYVARILNPNFKRQSRITREFDRRNPDPKSDVDSRIEIKIPYPVIVVGLAKSGTSSVEKFFRCGGVSSISHYYCDVTPTSNSGGIKQHYCGLCMKAAVEAGCAPLASCGGYDVWAQIEALPNKKMVQVMGKAICYFPQREALEAIHAESPNATFVLPIRPTDDWISSVDRWGNLRSFLREACGDLIGGRRGSNADLRRFYEGHSELVRNFVKRHPSHALVQLDVGNGNEGSVLEEAFGIDSHCWGRANENTGSLQAKLRNKN